MVAHKPDNAPEVSKDEFDEPDSLSSTHQVALKKDDDDNHLGPNYHGPRRSLVISRESVAVKRKSMMLPGTKMEITIPMTSINTLRRKSALLKYEDAMPLAKIVDGNKDLEDSYSYYEDSDAGEFEMEQKLTLYQACGLNTMNMFGTGPFITVPFVVATADPAGPHAMLGYAIAAFACLNDSLIWAELGSMWPDSGGSYVYLRELYGPHSWGRLCAFLFVWQIMVSGPMECASGFIATAQYVAYITETYTQLHHSLIAFGMCAATVWVLYREISEVGTVTLVLWAFTIAAIIFTIIVGYANYDQEYIESPPGAFDPTGAFFMSLGGVARFAVYDFTGYYDMNFVGKEVENPRKNIPIAVTVTCAVVAACFFLVDVAIISSLQWDENKGGYVELVTSGADGANYIMALFCETHISKGFAIFFTVIVAITIFGSCFSFMIGLAQIPYTAAKDGYFYEFLAHESEKHAGLQDNALLFVGALSVIFCFFELESVINGMLCLQLLCQFMGQGAGIMYYRLCTPKEHQEEAPFKVPFFPIPCILQLIIFSFIFITSDNYLILDHDPIMEMCLLFLLMGIGMYMTWAKARSFWPFNEEIKGDGGLDPVTLNITPVNVKVGGDDVKPMNVTTTTTVDDVTAGTEI